MGFVHVDPIARREDCFDAEALDALPAEWEGDFLRHIHLEEPLDICVDGRSGKAFLQIE